MVKGLPIFNKMFRVVAREFTVLLVCFKAVAKVFVKGGFLFVFLHLVICSEWLMRYC